MKQIFAFTETPGAPIDGYVKFLQVFQNEDGSYRVCIRNRGCVINEIDISIVEARALGAVLPCIELPPGEPSP